MGTRGAYGFIADGQIKLAYNHYDSYPAGLGEELAKQLSKLMKVHDQTSLKALGAAVTVVDGESKPTKAQKKKLAKWMNLSVGEQTDDDWYCLLRELQGDMQETLTNAGYMIDASEFPTDSLFCEWAYVADFDNMTLEVHQGFQKQPHKSGRFALCEGVVTTSRSNDYYPVKLVKVFKLDKTLIPQFRKWLKKLEKDAEKEE